VASVAPIGTTSNDVVTYPVTLTLDSPSATVKPGMSADVAIVTQSLNDVLAVPTSAVTGTGKTGSVEVRTAKGTKKRVPVVIAVAGTEVDGVYGDLTVGETVVWTAVTITPSTGSTGSTGSLGGTSLTGGGVRSFGGGGFGGFGGAGGFTFRRTAG
jgi:macrolide-specific efflux system membrane fusion protein